jgi:hypothetical protein
MFAEVSLLYYDLKTLLCRRTLRKKLKSTWQAGVMIFDWDLDLRLTEHNETRTHETGRLPTDLH